MLELVKENPEETIKENNAAVQVNTTNVGENVGVNESRLLELINKNPNITANIAAELLALSKRQTERLFSALRNC